MVAAKKEATGQMVPIVVRVKRGLASRIAYGLSLSKSGTGWP
jgi:hypothetical protein